MLFQPSAFPVGFGAERRLIKHLQPAAAAKGLFSLKGEETNGFKRKDARDKYFSDLSHRPVVLQGLQSIGVVQSPWQSLEFSPTPKNPPRVV